MEQTLVELLASIRPRDEETYLAARARLDSLCKPPGSLGRLEDIAALLAGVSGQVLNQVPRRAVVIAAADNGVVEEGVASADPAFTLTQTENFIRGVTGGGGARAARRRRSHRCGCRDQCAAVPSAHSGL